MRRVTTAAMAALTLTVGSGFTAGAATAVTPANAAPRAVGAESPKSGIWRVDGYGAVWSIRDGVLQEYETTSVSCLKGDVAKRTGPGRYLDGNGVGLTLRAGPGRDRAILHMDGTTGHQELRRVAKLPATCTGPAPEGPVATFDVFWQSYEENYPFFAAKGIDWHAMRDRYRPKVHADTTPEELFAIFSEMLDPLEDVVTVALPEEIHTGSPREAFCPESTATSEPPASRSVVRTSSRQSAIASSTMNTSTIPGWPRP